MARRKSRNQIGAQISRIQAAIRERSGGRGLDPVLARRSARAWDAYDRYNANIDRTRTARRINAETNRILDAGGQYTEEGNARLTELSREQNNRQYPRSVYMGRTYPAVTRDIPAGRTAPANGAPRRNTRTQNGITISQESLDAFRRRRDAAANGLNAG